MATTSTVARKDGVVVTESKLDKTRKELIRNIVAASSTTAFCVSLLNPLDVLRIKWQTRPLTTTALANQQQQTTLLDLAIQTTKQNGGIYNALYRPGLGVNALSVACSSGFRLGIYPLTKNVLTRVFVPVDQREDETKPWIMFASGFISGAIGFFLATPLFTAKIQAQSYLNHTNKSGYQFLKETIQSGKPFAGSSVLVARGALFSAGFSAGYDGTKTEYRKLYPERGENLVVHVSASLVAAFVATLMAAPFDAILTKYQNGRSFSSSSIVDASTKVIKPQQPPPGYQTPIECIVDMYQNEGGVRRFFKGWSLFFCRVVPLFVIQLPMYEQTRKFLGMDFMR